MKIFRECLLTVVVLTLCVLNFSGCTKEKNQTENSKESDFCIGQRERCLLNENYFYVDNDILNFVNLESGESGILCTKPECKHTDDKCLARCAKLTRIVYSQDKVYEFITGDFGKSELIEYDYKNSHKKVLTQIDGDLGSTIADVFCKDQKLYFASITTDIDENMKTTQTGSVNVYDIKENKLYSNKLNVGENVSFMGVYNTKIYYTREETDENYVAHHSIYCYDYKTNKDELLKENCSFYSFNDNYAVCCNNNEDGDNNYYKLDMETDEFELLDKISEYGITKCIGKTIIIMKIENDKTTYFSYDISSDKITEMGELNGALLLANDKFIVYLNSTGEVYYQKTQDFLNGDMTGKKIQKPEE